MLTTLLVVGFVLAAGPAAQAPDGGSGPSSTPPPPPPPSWNQSPNGGSQTPNGGHFESTPNSDNQPGNAKPRTGPKTSVSDIVGPALPGWANGGNGPAPAPDPTYTPPNSSDPGTYTGLFAVLAVATIAAGVKRATTP